MLTRGYPEATVTITGIHHLGLTVRDVDASAEWYSTVLGFAHIGEYISPDHSRRKVFLGHSRLGVRIGLCEHERSGDELFDEARPGLDHLAFAVDGIDELGEYEVLLQSHGVVYTPTAPANTLEGARVLVFRDPDNIQLELVALGG